MPNGIDVSEGTGVRVVAAIGSQDDSSLQIAAARRWPPSARCPVPIRPDNIPGRPWKLLTAVPNYCADQVQRRRLRDGWSVLGGIQKTLAFKRLGGADQRRDAGRDSACGERRHLRWVATTIVSPAYTRRLEHE